MTPLLSCKAAPCETVLLLKAQVDLEMHYARAHSNLVRAPLLLAAVSCALARLLREYALGCKLNVYLAWMRPYSISAALSRSSCC